jgi:predicted DNA-binding transcriptional regulator AlpA
MKTQREIHSEAPHETMPMKPEDILTPKQLAERLQVKTSWVYEMCRGRASYREKPMPCMRIGKYLRFYWPDICEWMRNGDNTGQSEPRSHKRQ